MTRPRDKDERLAALGRLVAEYEAEHGFITDDELADQAQQDREGYKPTILPTRPVSRGFIPERRKRPRRDGRQSGS